MYYQKEVQNIFCFFLLLFSLSILVNKVFAEKKGNERGLYLRIIASFGLSRFEVIDNITKEEDLFSGVKPYTAFEIGAFITPRIALYGGISKLHGINTKNRSKQYLFSSYTLASRKFGFIYYFPKYNVHISSHLRLFGRATHNKRTNRFIGTKNVDFVKIEESYDSGRGFGLSVGKEWIGKSKWHTGLELSIFYESLKGETTKIIRTNTSQNLANVGDAKVTYIGISITSSYY